MLPARTLICELIQNRRHTYQDTGRVDSARHFSLVVLVVKDCFVIILLIWQTYSIQIVWQSHRTETFTKHAN